MEAIRPRLEYIPRGRPGFDEAEEPAEEATQPTGLVEARRRVESLSRSVTAATEALRTELLALDVDRVLVARMGEAGEGFAARMGKLARDIA